VGDRSLSVAREDPAPLRGVTLDGMNGTLRERIVSLLEENEWSFDGLRRELELQVVRLDEELRHVERSVRSRGMTLAVRSARCRGCGFTFSRARSFKPPGRCPRCRRSDVAGPWLRVR
jgi:predicted Zn-ribbon and HTH transcriptional regulator